MSTETKKNSIASIYEALVSLWKSSNDMEDNNINDLTPEEADVSPEVLAELKKVSENPNAPWKKQAESYINEATNKVSNRLNKFDLSKVINSNTERAMREYKKQIEQQDNTKEDDRTK